MYAVITEIVMDPERQDDVRQFLRESREPMVSVQEGFIRGVWLHSLGEPTGCGVMLFDSEADAMASAERARAQEHPADAPLRLARVEVFEVIAEA